MGARKFTENMRLDPIYLPANVLIRKKVLIRYVRMPWVEVLRNFRVLSIAFSYLSILYFR